ncbi:GNAT family N-acetyltransferase [Mesorhizobium sp. CAU 1732]|uniref:GNAT family N-acetyltransferase n=1 Tax=Mesorhizobium sp. CAU 1732 TaxID=3140358 RepID=UPI0032612D82
MAIRAREASPEDAAAMCAVINPLIAKGGSTAHRNPFDTARMISHYIAPPTGIACVVAVDGETVVGFQSVSWSGEPALGEAAVGSFVAMEQHGRGIGRIMFRETLDRAKAAGVRTIDATIRKENVSGRAFYRKLGFVPYKEGDETVSKLFTVAG